MVLFCFQIGIRALLFGSCEVLEMDECSGSSGVGAVGGVVTVTLEREPRAAGARDVVHVTIDYAFS